MNKNTRRKWNNKDRMHDWVDGGNETRPNDVWKQSLVSINKIKIHWGQLEFTVFIDILVDLVCLDLRSLLCKFCRTSLAWSFLLHFLSNDEQKCHKSNPHEKHWHQNSLKQALLCSAPRVWNSIHMFPFDPCYCSHWNTNPATFPQPHDWICLRARKRRCASL